MTKNELLGALHNLLNNFVVGLVLPRIVPEAEWRKLADRRATFQAPDGSLLHIDLTPLATNFSNPRDRKLLIDEYENGLKRSLLSEGHEVLLAYCEQTNQFAVYKAEPWFQFARILRNVVSHKDGGILRAWPADLTKAGKTTVAWRARTLDSSQVGKPVEFTHNEALQLFADQLQFAQSKLA